MINIYLDSLSSCLEILFNQNGLRKDKKPVHGTWGSMSLTATVEIIRDTHKTYLDYWLNSSPEEKQGLWSNQLGLALTTRHTDRHDQTYHQYTGQSAQLWRTSGRWQWRTTIGGNKEEGPVKQICKELWAKRRGFQDRVSRQSELNGPQFHWNR